MNIEKPYVLLDKQFIQLKQTMVHTNLGGTLSEEIYRDMSVNHILLKSAISDDVKVLTRHSEPCNILDSLHTPPWLEEYEKLSVLAVSDKAKKSVGQAISAVAWFTISFACPRISILRRLGDHLLLLITALLIIVSRIPLVCRLVDVLNREFPVFELTFEKFSYKIFHVVNTGYYTNITRRREEHKLRQFELWVKKSPYALAGICQILNSLDGSPESRELNHIVALYPEFRAKDTTDKRRFHWAAGYCPDSGEPYLYFGPLEPKEYPISGRDFHTLLVER